MKERQTTVGFTPLVGRWESSEGRLTYLGPQTDPPSGWPYGLALASAKLRKGTLSATVILPPGKVDKCGRFVIGYDAESGAYYSVGIGGYIYHYVIDRYLPSTGWRALAGAGSRENLVSSTAPYQAQGSVRGQRVELAVNGTLVVASNLPTPVISDQVGFFGWGPGPVTFEGFAMQVGAPKAFVVMQFGEPYNSLYTEVIKPVFAERKMEVYHADEIYRPGYILQDITTGIRESELIVAEITPANPNVFYELGYAHAVGKPTILLAERGKELPFDIKGFRCIFYDNTIKGKRQVETDLRRHLASILGEA